MSISFVNGTSSWIDDSTHGNRTITQAGIVAGNLIIVSATFGADISNVTCTDNLGTPTVYQIQSYTYDSTNQQVIVTFWGIALASGTVTATVTTPSSTPGEWRLALNQYNATGGWTSSPVDGQMSNLQSYTNATDNMGSDFRTTVNNGDLIYACVFDTQLGASSWAAGTGFTSRANNHAFGVEDKIQSSAGSVQATFTATPGSTAGICHMIAFSEATGSGGTGGNPSGYVDFETSTNGTALTTAIQNACTKGNTVGWAAGYTSTGFVISTSGEEPLQTAITVISTSYNDVGSTRGARYSNATATDANPLTWNKRGPYASVFFWMFITLPTSDTGFYSFNALQNILGSDFAGVMITTGQLYLETQGNPNGNPDTGSKYNYTANVWYGICLTHDCRSGKAHRLVITDSVGNVLSTQTKANNGVGVPAQFLNFGRAGDSGTTASFVYFDDIIIDGETPNKLVQGAGSGSVDTILMQKRLNFKVQ